MSESSYEENGVGGVGCVWVCEGKESNYFSRTNYAKLWKHIQEQNRLQGSEIGKWCIY